MGQTADGTRHKVDWRIVGIGLAAVLLANLRYLSGLPEVLDPVIAMEPFYIAMARQSVTGILMGDPAWGPLYALWLKPLTWLTTNPVDIYTANIGVLSITLSCSLFLYVLVLTRRSLLALAAALFFLASDFNVPLPNKASAFALLVVLVGFAVAQFSPRRSTRLTLTALFLLVAAGARPEVLPAAVVLFGVSLHQMVMTPAPPAPRACNAILAGIFLVALSAGILTYATAASNDRLAIAFREHFAWNWVEQNRAPLNVFAIWQAEFGDAKTVLDAIRANPAAVATHLAANVRGTMRFLLCSPARHYPLLAPASKPAWVAIEQGVTTLLFLMPFGYVLFRSSTRRRFLDRYGDSLLVYGIAAVPSAAAAILVYPMAHYLMLPAALLLLACLLAWDLLLPETDRGWKHFSLWALMALAVVPRPFVLPSAYTVAGSPFLGEIQITRRVRDTIEAVRRLKLPAPTAVLTVTDGIGVMLGPEFHEFKVWDRGTQPLREFMQDRNVTLVVNLEPGRISLLADDPYWGELQMDPAAAGFTQVGVPNHPTVGVYVRSDVLAPAAHAE